MSNTRDTGFLRNAIQVTDQGVTFVSGSTTLMSISSSGAVTTTGVISGSNALSSSFSLNSALLNGIGSIGFATTGALLEVSSSQQQISSSQQQISASLLNVVANYATTGSNSFRANQSITGSLVVSSTITAQTLVVQTVTSSIVYSSGSNIFGNQLANTQTFTGSVNITGSLALAGNITSNGTAVVLGSGTSNYLPKFTAASTIGNSLVVDNGTNIGIGTTNPTAGRLQINVSDTTTAAHFQIVDGTTTLADSFVTNFRNANDGDGRYSLSRWQVQNAVGNDQIGFIGVQSITGAGAYTPNIVFGQRTGVSTYATRMTLDSSGNLGIGVTPSAWYVSEGYRALQVGNASLFGRNSTNSELYLSSNTFDNSSGYPTYITSDFATRYYQNDGLHAWLTAPSGTAGAAITFTQAMTLTAAGELLINTTSDAGDWKLQVNGSAYFTNTNSVGYTYLTIGNSGASGRSYDIGVGGNGVSSPYQNSFYVYDNIAGQPRFYINSSGAAAFASNITLPGNINYTSGDGADWYINPPANGPTIRLKYHGGSTNRSGALGWVDNSGNRYDSLTWADGNVTTPNNPAFRAYYSINSTWTLASGATFAFDTTEYNIGSCYNTSNGRFTAPVAGVYQFNFYTIVLGAYTDAAISLKKNGGNPSSGYNVHFTPTQAGSWSNVVYTTSLYLNASDYVYMTTGGASTVYHGDDWSSFSGYLVG